MADQPTDLGSQLYLSFLQAYQVGDDTKPTTNPDALAVYTKFMDSFNKYTTSGNAMWLKRDMEDIKLQLENAKSVRKMMTDLQETAGKTQRVSAQNITRLLTNLTDNRTKVATAYGTGQQRAWDDAKKAFDQGGGTGPAAQAAAAEALFKTLSAEGSKVERNNPTIQALAASFSQTVLGKPLGQMTPEQAQKVIYDATGGNSVLANNVFELIRVGQESRAATERVGVSLEEVGKRLNEVTAPDGTVDPRTAKKILGTLEGANAQLESLGQDPRFLQEKLKDIQANDEHYQRLLDTEKFLRDQVQTPGKEGLHSQMGRLVADPNFRAWAEDNGLRLGEAMVDENGRVLYTPGPDDEKAIVRFNYQASHPGRYGRLFFNKSDSGELVTVTATDPAERERLLRERDLGDGKYAVDTTGGRALVLSPTEYESHLQAKGLAPGDIQVATAGNEFYVKDPLGQVSKLSADGTLTPVDNAPSNAVFKTAVVYPSDSNAPAERYLTPADLKNPEVLKHIGNAEPSDEAAIKASIPEKSGIKFATADEVPTLGQVQVMGYRKRLNANDMVKYGPGAFGVVDPATGKTTMFSSGVTFEVYKKAPNETPAEVLDKRRQEFMEKKGLPAPMTPQELIDVKAKKPPEPPEVPVRSTALEKAAVVSEEPQARIESGMRGSEPTISPQGAAAAAADWDRYNAAKAQAGATAPPAGAPAPTPATPTTPAAAAPPTPAATAPPAAKPAPALTPAPAPAASAPAAAPAPATAPAPAKPDVAYMRDNRGAVYAISEAGAQQIQPEPGKTLDTRKIPADSKEFDTLTGRLATGGKALTDAEVTAIKTRSAAQVPGSETPAKVEPKVGEWVGNTRIEREYTPPPSFLEKLFTRRKAAKEGGEAAGEKVPQITPKQAPATAAQKKQSAEDQKTREAAVASAPAAELPEASDTGPVTRTTGNFARLRGESLRDIPELSSASPLKYPDIVEKFAAIEALKKSDPRKYFEEANTLATELRRRKRTSGSSTPVSAGAQISGAGETESPPPANAATRELIKQAEAAASPEQAPKMPTFNEVRKKAFTVTPKGGK